ncbi:hypothetical protein [Microbacterium hydrocarbonoxydans]|uniref:Uncharacterized protein n=1 Tax=Microbacterium hydrocarbonoxydans TaxID=273678 RepID=A0A1H4RG59_9MICO|nr:hypothetical protein [Microbacterium hydrocarbonoxydans]SEC30661.1 hypothetical protein SAMN04489807_3382 [Microbacterium hydrocarbonoxydans]
MGLFQQRPEEQENEWALPSEPIERSESEVLDTAPAIDPLTIGLGLGAGASVSSIVFPVAPPAPDAFSIENREPDDESGDAGNASGTDSDDN